MKIRFSGSPVTCITEMVVENRFRNGLAYTLLKSTRRRPETLQMSWNQRDRKEATAVESSSDIYFASRKLDNDSLVTFISRSYTRIVWNVA